eukprot:5859795-Pyramimonas_sp.AAC.1
MFGRGGTRGAEEDDGDAPLWLRGSRGDGDTPPASGSGTRLRRGRRSLVPERSDAQGSLDLPNLASPMGANTTLR